MDGLREFFGGFFPAIFASGFMIAGDQARNAFLGAQDGPMSHLVIMIVTMVVASYLAILAARVENGMARMRR